MTDKSKFGPRTGVKKKPVPDSPAKKKAKEEADHEKRLKLMEKTQNKMLSQMEAMTKKLGDIKVDVKIPELKIPEIVMPEPQVNYRPAKYVDVTGITHDLNNRIDGLRFEITHADVH